MQVSIACKHGTINEEAREHLTSKAEKLLTYFERLTQILITVNFGHQKTHETYQVEILVDAEHKHNLVASSEGDNVIHAFDAALKSMEHQIKKYKEKIQDHRRTPPMNELAESEQSESE